MAVVELTCMAPDKDAGDGKKRCKGLPGGVPPSSQPLVEADGGGRVVSWAQTNEYDMGRKVQQYRCRTGPLPAMATVVAQSLWSLPSKDAPMAHAADGVGCGLLVPGSVGCRGCRGCSRRRGGTCRTHVDAIACCMDMGASVGIGRGI